MLEMAMTALANVLILWLFRKPFYLVCGGHHSKLKMYGVPLGGQSLKFVN